MPNDTMTPAAVAARPLITIALRGGRSTVGPSAGHRRMSNLSVQAWTWKPWRRDGLCAALPVRAARPRSISLPRVGAADHAHRADHLGLRCEEAEGPLRRGLAHRRA